MTLVNTSEDQFLVDAAKRGDYQAFSTLVNHNEKRVYAIAMQILHNHQDALDVVQSTFLAAIEHLADFRQQASFSTWIGRITINTALKVYESEINYKQSLWKPQRKKMKMVTSRIPSILPIGAKNQINCC